MELASLLNPELITINLKGSTKRDVFEEMVNLIHSRKMITDPDSALFSILDREKLGSTGVGHGIALPHSKTSAAKQTVMAVAVLKDSIEFASIDGLPVKLVIMTLYPPGAAGIHLEILAELAHVFIDNEFTKKIIAAADPAALYELLVNSVNKIDSD